MSFPLPIPALWGLQTGQHPASKSTNIPTNAERGRQQPNSKTPEKRKLELHEQYDILYEIRKQHIGTKATGKLINVVNDCPTSSQEAKSCFQRP